MLVPPVEVRSLFLCESHSIDQATLQDSIDAIAVFGSG